MYAKFSRTIGAVIAGLLGLIATPAAVARPTVQSLAPVESDWQYPEALEVLPSAQRRTLNIDSIIEPIAPVSDSETPVSESSIEDEHGSLSNDKPAVGVHDAILKMGAPSGWNDWEARRLDAASTGVVSVSIDAAWSGEFSTASASENATLLEPISQWLPHLIEEWTGSTSTAVTPWAIVAGVSLLLLLFARLLRWRYSELDTSHITQKKDAARNLKHACKQTKGPAPVRQLATIGTNSGAEPSGELEDWILESLKSEDGSAGADNASRDKSEERRQLESWRKLSQVHSKAFILKEEEDAAKKNAMWLSLVAVAFGVSGLGIVATSCLGPYSLLSGACLAATSLVIFGWSGVKVVFHQLRRWILLRPARS